jgi:hypothetical protein
MIKTDVYAPASIRKKDQENQPPPYGSSVGEAAGIPGLFDNPAG